VTAEIKTETEY